MRSVNVWRLAFLFGVAAAGTLSALGRVETSSTIEIGSGLQVTGGVCQTPAAQTGPATTIGPFGATLNGGAGGAFGAWFDYGLTTTYDNSTPVFGFPGQCYGGYSIAVSELTCSTQYHFRAVVQGYGGIAHGDDAVFTTLPCPAPTVGQARPAPSRPPPRH